MKQTQCDRTMHITSIYERHFETIWNICFTFLKNPADTEDAVQETFVRLLSHQIAFSSEEHEKAWLMTVAANRCRDILRLRKRHPQIDAEALGEVPAQTADSSGILEALLALPEKFRLVLTLYYVEEYPVEAIAEIIGRTSSAVKMRLRKGRKLLEELYRKEYL